MASRHILTQNEIGYNCSTCGPTEVWTRRGKLKCKGVAEYAQRRGAYKGSAKQRQSGYGDYRKFKIEHGDGTCWWCGFTCVLPGQLQVDHFDGDRTNNAKNNLWILCGNCHHMKTILAGDIHKTKRIKGHAIRMLLPNGVLAWVPSPMKVWRVLEKDSQGYPLKAERNTGNATHDDYVLYPPFEENSNFYIIGYKEDPLL